MKQNKTFAAAVNTHWLAWAGPDARTPGRKDCACTWASPPLLSSSGGGKGPSSAERESALGVSLRVWRASAAGLRQSSPLTPSQLIHTMKPPHDLSYAFPVICFLPFFVCLFIQTADYRSVSCFSTSDAVGVSAAPQLTRDLRLVAPSLLISAPAWRCFRQRAQANTAWTKQEREGE